MVPGVPLHPANRGGICGGTFGDIGLRGASMDKLTATAIRNAKPADKPVRLFDGRGLYLEVTPTGRRYWRLKYRYAGKEKRLALACIRRSSRPKRAPTGAMPGASLGEGGARPPHAAPSAARRKHRPATPLQASPANG